MEKVKISPKFQVVIPKRIREELQIKPGQELFIYTLDGKLYLDMPRSIKELRGMAKGIRWEHSDRDHTDRF